VVSTTPFQPWHGPRATGYCWGVVLRGPEDPFEDEEGAVMKERGRILIAGAAGDALRVKVCFQDERRCFDD
jgi:hypothetical protein